MKRCGMWVSMGLAALSAVVSEAARPLTTDRPDATESPFTVEPQRVQLEVSAAQWTRDAHTPDQDGTRTETWNLAPFNVRLGLSARTELQIVHDGYVREEVRDRSSVATTSTRGLGDLTLRFKANFRGNDEGRLGVGIMPYLKLPTAARDLGNDKVEGGIILPFAYEISETWGFGAMTDVAVARNADNTRYLTFALFTATISRSLGERLGVFTEITCEVGDGKPGITLNTGATYGLGDNLQLDVGANVGVTRAADDLTLFAGLAYRY